MQTKQFFDQDAYKFEQDRWKARPEARYDYVITKQALAEAIRFFRNNRYLRVLDVGCGTGLWGRELRNMGYELDYLGVDFSVNMLAKAKEADIIARVKSNYVLADAEALPLRGKRYDLVLSIHVLEYLKSPTESLRQIREVLSPEGIVILITKNADGILWRLANKGSEILRANPLRSQRWFHTNELIDMVTSAGFLPLHLRGVGLRPPTYLGDVNNAMPVGLPTFVSKLLCKLILPLETRFSRLSWLTKLCFWHLCIICRGA